MSDLTPTIRLTDVSHSRVPVFPRYHEWLSWLSLAPVLVAAVVFKLALSDGGRHPASLVLAQTAVLALLAVLVGVGAVPRVRLLHPMLGMLVAIALTGLWSVRPEASVRELLLWTTYAGVFVAVASTLGTIGAARRFLDAMVAIAGWLCLIAAFTYWGAGNPGMRWYSTFYWPNPFAAFLLLVLPLEYARLIHAQGRRDAIAHGALAVLLVVSFIMTFSRGAWLSLLMIVPVGLVLMRPRSWRRAAGRSVTLVVVVAVVVTTLSHGYGPGVLGAALAQRANPVADSGDLSLQGRLHFWRAAREIFNDYPVTGTGPGTFGAVHARYQVDSRFYARDAHNLYLQVAAEMGLIGLAALGMLVAAILRLWLRSLSRTRSTEAYPLILGVGLGLCAFLVHSVLDMDWMFPANPAMAFALVGVLAFFDRAATPAGGVRRSRRPWWRTLAAIGLLCGIAATQLFQAAEREFVRGRELARQGRWPAALERYMVATTLNPLNAKYLSARAVALMQTPHPQPRFAEKSLRNAMALDRMNASHPLELAVLVMQHGGVARFGEAEVLLRQALMLDSVNRPEIYRELAGLHSRQGRVAEATRVYQEGITQYLGRGLGGGSVTYALLWPEVIRLVMDASEAAVREGDLTAGARLLRALHDEDPFAVPVALRLSALYRQMGWHSEARAVLEATAARVPGDPRIRSALERLR